MTETPWSPTGTPEPGEQAEGGGHDRRRVVLFGGLALAALASVGALLLSGPDETVLEQTAAPAPAAPEPTGSATPPATAVPRAADARTGRDPFLDPAPAAAVVEPVSGEAFPTSGEPAGAVPAGAVPAVPAPQVVPGAPVPDVPFPAVPDDTATSLSLLRVDGSGDARRAVFRVGDEQVTAGVGDSFGAAANLLLLSLQEGPEPGQWTAVVQVGKGEPFDVVTGTPVSVA